MGATGNFGSMGSVNQGKLLLADSATPPGDLIDSTV